jgi:hypothetical protein
MSSMLPIGVWGHPNPYPLTSALLISESSTHFIRHTATTARVSLPGMFVITSIHSSNHLVLGDVGPIISKRVACCCLEFGVQYDPPIHYVGLPHFMLFGLNLLTFLSLLPLFLSTSLSSFLFLLTSLILHLHCAPFLRSIAHHTNTDCLMLGAWGL